VPAALAAGLRVLGHPFRDAATGDAECVITDGTVIDTGSPLTPPGYVSPTGIVLFASAPPPETGGYVRWQEPLP
jgi:hypothetical protein